MIETDLQKEAKDAHELLKLRAQSGGLLAFTILTKPDYDTNWHHKAMCRVLNKFIRKEIKRVMVFMPPRHGKSELVSRRLPALLHGLYPNDELMAATYNAELAGDMTVDVQRIMDREAYHDLFPRSRITPEGTTTRYARNSTEHEILPIIGDGGEVIYFKGKYRAQGIGGSFSGRGANWILIDDPVKNRDDSDSKTVRENVWKFYTSTLRTRLEGEGSILLTMTRWHEDDLAGRLLQLAKSDPEADQWTVIRFPAIRDDQDNPDDPRELGEALWPAKFNELWLTGARKAGSRDWSALYQQKPTSEDGNIFKASWFRYYDVIPDKFDQIIQSWDFAVKDKTGADYNVGTVWGRLGTNKYLLHMERGRWSFPAVCQKVLDVTKRFPRSYKKLIEAKANGPAVKQTVDRYVTGIVEIEPRGDKVARANAVAPEVEGGSVWLPKPQIAPWINDYVTEMCSFPLGTHDDIVDSTTMALDELRKAQILHMPSSGHGSGTIF
jgi:predicted phage terminase large subunit-like protein